MLYREWVVDGQAWKQGKQSVRLSPGERDGHKQGYISEEAEEIGRHVGRQEVQNGKI